MIRASAGLIDGAETVVGAGGGGTIAGSGDTPGAVEVEATTVVVLVVAVVSARVPSVLTRRTMSTPLRPSAPLIVFGRLLPKELDRFTNARVPEFDPRNDDRVQLRRDPRRARRVFGKCIGDRADGLAVFPDRLFPGFLDLPELARTRFVVGLFAVMRLRQVEPLLAPARGDVIRIEVEHLLVFLESEIVTAAVVITFRVIQQLFHFLNFREKLRTDRAVDRCGSLRRASISAAGRQFGS